MFTCRYFVSIDEKQFFCAAFTFVWPFKKTAVYRTARCAIVFQLQERGGETSSQEGKRLAAAIDRFLGLDSIRM